MSKCIILDDDETFQRLHRRRLIRLGLEEYMVFSFDSNEEALRFLEENPDVDRGVFDWNLNPYGRSGGPYTEGAVRRILETHGSVLLTSGTDDSTGRLSELMRESGDEARLRFVDKRLLETGDYEFLVADTREWQPQIS
ncbi:hypothetical protein A2982_00245 [candidate division WWE3 bacterium RIFCSPLOWO2_01_FULL_39_13]|uniref:Response regulatory domain-containing protein n=1 Tax=candidate division WWE3 bacterium RIFCSPLOWO2_01_FULL_39_13 TaxID=1802624 RepID=A0A1F4V4C1_UNCKA|nr:MAG: hypothetical protein A2982_00245 [candidate division WWE3 bacterium RIFCSPLOWO2_01_FULL_39_13]